MDMLVSIVRQDRVRSCENSQYDHLVPVSLTPGHSSAAIQRTNSAQLPWLIDQPQGEVMVPITIP
jgi:hypothetical protein